MRYTRDELESNMESSIGYKYVKQRFNGKVIMNKLMDSLKSLHTESRFACMTPF